MSDSPKTSILKLATDQGHTESYGALLYTTALLEYDPTALVPESEEETYTWRGHLLGLRSALHCLAMHEQKYGPQMAGVLVDRHLASATDLLKQRDDTGSDG